MDTSVKTIDAYIAGFPKEVQPALNKMHGIIKKAAPKATESINYGIPTFSLDGNLVHFGGYKTHIGFYPAPSGIEAFKKELSVYKGAKGSVQFPLDKPLPAGLITQIVKFRVIENKEKAAAKKNKKTVVKKAVPKKAISKPSGESEINAWINKLDAAGKKDVNAVRQIIKGASPKLSERIKWNAPSYYYKDDIVTFGPYKTHKLLLIFHHPEIEKIKSPLLEGNYKGRRLVHLADIKAANAAKAELKRIIKELIKGIDNK